MMWEMMMMLLQGSTDYIQQVKEKCMLDLLYSSDVDDHLPSARVLNTHHTFKILPKQYHNRKHVLGKNEYCLGVICTLLQLS